MFLIKDTAKLLTDTKKNTKFWVPVHALWFRSISQYEAAKDRKEEKLPHLQVDRQTDKNRQRRRHAGRDKYQYTDRQTGRHTYKQTDIKNTHL